MLKNSNQKGRIPNKNLIKALKSKEDKDKDKKKKKKHFQNFGP